MKDRILSASDEAYEKHLDRVMKEWNLLKSRFESIVKRTIGIPNWDWEQAVKKMLLYHDLGKLTERWQNWQKMIKDRKKTPPHSQIGAAYLFKTLPEGIRQPISFAVLIHHTDVGIVSDALERPDVLLVQNWVCDFSGRIIWCEQLNDIPQNDLFPADLRQLTLQDTTSMARELRLWARGENILTLHQRRLQASVFHHILRLCDVRAASQRNENQVHWVFVQKLVEGGFLC